MTNEEKAVELLPNIPTLECLCCDIREKLVEMAEWKDKQFEKKRKSFLTRPVNGLKAWVGNFMMMLKQMLLIKKILKNLENIWRDNL